MTPEQIIAAQKALINQQQRLIDTLLMPKNMYPPVYTPPVYTPPIPSPGWVPGYTTSEVKK